jgi:hypothetical protein
MNCMTTKCVPTHSSKHAAAEDCNKPCLPCRAAGGLVNWAERQQLVRLRLARRDGGTGTVSVEGRQHTEVGTWPLK